MVFDTRPTYQQEEDQKAPGLWEPYGPQDSPTRIARTIPTEPPTPKERTPQWWENNTFRGWDTKEIAPKEYEDFDLGETMKQMDDAQKKIEETLQSARDSLASQMESAFSAMRGGWKSSIDWMADYMLKKLFAKMAMSMIPGLGPAASAAGSGIVETPGLFPYAEKSFGAAGTLQKAAAWRNARG
jgi:hypothetical protein